MVKTDLVPAGGGVRTDKEYEDFDDIPDDGSGEGYTVIDGYKVRKAEDGDAYIDVGATRYFGRHWTEALKKAKAGTGGVNISKQIAAKAFNQPLKTANGPVSLYGRNAVNRLFDK